MWQTSQIRERLTPLHWINGIWKQLADVTVPPTRRLYIPKGRAKLVELRDVRVPLAA